jgi:parallel beta-helix repeat protein
MIVRMMASLVMMGLLAGEWAAPARAETAAILEVGTNAACVYHTIAAAIAAANPGDTIKVQKGVFTETALIVSENLTLTGGYNAALYACLTLTGSGYTTVQQTEPSTSRILSVQGATVNVSWFIFENNADGGGVEVINNGTLNLNHATIRNNTGSWGGGLNVVSATANLTDCDLNDNTATWGGGLSVVSAVANLTDCDLNDNVATSGGGGMDTWGTTPVSTVTLTRVAFRRNSAGTDGGALLIEQGAQVTANDWVAIGIDGSARNRATRNGGGVGILNSGSRLTINASSALSYLSWNAADRHGGGAYVDAGQIVLNGVMDPMFDWRIVLSYNVADFDGNGSGDGGGIYATNGATVQVDSTDVNGNSAQVGGGLYLYSSAATLDGNRIRWNDAVDSGGGLYLWNSDAVTLTRNIIVENTAGYGSGLYIAYSDATFINNAFIYNQVTHADGALRVLSSSPRLTHNTFAYNSVGSAIRIDHLGSDYSSVALTNTIVMSHSTGITVLAGDTARLESTLWYHNTSDVSGAGATTAHNYWGDPLLAGDGYHLQVGSAAIDQGVNAGVATDIDGEPRLGNPDLGADEYIRAQVFLPLVLRNH